jgi:hypothetical protein
MSMAGGHKKQMDLCKETGNSGKRQGITVDGRNQFGIIKMKIKEGGTVK